MVWVWIAAGAGLAATSLVWLGFIPSPLAMTLIRYGKGKLEVVKGSLLPHARSQVTEILESVDISNCFITVSPQNKVSFSRRVPSSIFGRPEASESNDSR